MGEESVTNNESYADERVTLDLLGAIDKKVGHLPVREGKPWNYPGQPHGEFASTTKEGVPVVLRIVKIPIQASRRGEIALVARSGSTEDGIIPADYFFFNDGDGVEIHELVRDTAPYTRPPNADDMTFEEKVMHQFSIQRNWDEARLEMLRTEETSKLEQTAAEDLLGEVSRAVLIQQTH